VSVARVREVEQLLSRIAWLEQRLEERENLITDLADKIARLKFHQTNPK